MKKIAVRLWLGIMAMVGLMLALIWIFMILFLEDFYVQARISRVEKTCSAVLELRESGDQAGFESEVGALVNETNGTVELTHQNGETLYLLSSGEKSVMPLENNDQKTEAYQTVLSGKETMVQIAHPRFNTDYVLIGLPYIVDGTQEGGFFIMFPLADVQDTAEILKTQTVYLTGILLVASVAAAYVLSKMFSKPIKSITKTAERISGGDFFARAQVKSKDEIGVLAETVNTMGHNLEKIESLRRDLITNVSHELRTPLSLIGGYAETIRDVTGDNPEKRNRQLGIIIEETNRLSGMVNNMLDLSQMQAGFLKLHIEPFDLSELIEEIRLSYEQLARQSDFSLTVECAPVIVSADRERIRQVLHNLLGNAFKYTPAGGSVTVLVQSGDKVQVKVSDTGAGIPQDQLDRIWERFYKADPESKKGMGLGLSIVKGILEAHQCGYGVTSEVGKGTTFRFELPSDAAQRPVIS